MAVTRRILCLGDDMLKNGMLAGALALAVATALTRGVSLAQDFLHQINIVRLDPRFDKLVPLNLKIESIASRHKWVEGPVWNRREGYCFSPIFRPIRSTNGKKAKA